jgi:uncharacterized protein (DUF58 family)
VRLLRRLLRRAEPAPAPVPPEYPAELLQRVRRLEVKTRGLVESLLGGEYASVFRGRGLDFSHVREYRAGDDVRAIDWRITARRQDAYVRQFVEERDLTLVLLVDGSASHRFGTGERSHAEVAAEVAGALALCAGHTNDRVALVLVTDRVERFVPPRAGKSQILRLVLDLLSYRPASPGTDLAAGLDRVVRSFAQRALVVAIGDFVVDPRDERLRQSLRRVAHSHDLVAVRLVSPQAEALPDLGWVALVDPETGRRTVVDSGSRRLRTAFHRQVVEGQAELRALLGELRLDLLDLDTGGDYFASLVHFFRNRRRITA